MVKSENEKNLADIHMRVELYEDKAETRYATQQVWNSSMSKRMRIVESRTFIMWSIGIIITGIITQTVINWIAR